VVSWKRVRVKAGHDPEQEVRKYVVGPPKDDFNTTALSRITPRLEADGVHLQSGRHLRNAYTITSRFSPHPRPLSYKERGDAPSPFGRGVG
jgi:hypothetical protein